MNRLALAIALTVAAPAAHAQSMNVRAITETVTRDICAPFIRSGDMWAAIGAAERAGYAIDHIAPASLSAGAADRQAEPIEVQMRGSHAGVIRMRHQSGLRICSVGIHEGSVGTIAETAAPWLTALGMAPALDERDGPLAVSIWRGEDRQAVISRSTEFRPGSELVISAVVQVD